MENLVLKRLPVLLLLPTTKGGLKLGCMASSRKNNFMAIRYHGKAYIAAFKCKRAALQAWPKFCSVAVRWRECSISCRSEFNGIGYFRLIVAGKIKVSVVQPGRAGEQWFGFSVRHMALILNAAAHAAKYRKF